MKKEFYQGFFIVLLTILPSFVFAQHKFSDIQLIEVGDFQAKPPENSKFPIYTNSRVYYRIDTVIQNSKNKYEVHVKTKVEMYKEGSFWDSVMVKQDATARMLNHEQGHFYIAHIAANKLEKELSSLTYSENWKEEVNKKFHELNKKFGRMDVDYDEETLHGRDLTAQRKWDKWIRKQLN